jgi:chromosome segregation ATPase
MHELRQASPEKPSDFTTYGRQDDELKQLRNQNLRLLRELKEKKAEVEGLRRSMQSQPTNSSLIKHYERKSTEQEAEIKELKKQLEQQESKAKRSIELETRRLWRLVEEGDLKLQQLQRHLEAQRTGTGNGIHDSMTILRSENDKLKGQISQGYVRATQELSTTEFSEIDRQIKDLELMQNSLIEENRQLKSRLEAQPKVLSYSFILKALVSIRRELQQLKTVAKSMNDELEPSLRLLLLSDNTHVEVPEGREELMIMTELDLVRSGLTDLRNALTAIVAVAYGHNLLI